MKQKDLQAERNIKQLFSRLQPQGKRDLRAVAQGRAKFLDQAAALRMEMATRRQPVHIPARRTFLPVLGRRSLFKTLLALCLAIAVFLGGSAATVYAAQGSLPGESLYPIKTFSEDALLSLTTSKEQRLNLVLQFTDRRLAELTALKTNGQPVPEVLIQRYQNELDQSLQLAAGLSDPVMLPSLDRISQHAKDQLQGLSNLPGLSPEAPDLANLKANLQNQVKQTEAGETNPEGFRTFMHGQNQPEPANSWNNSGRASSTPDPTRQDQDNGQGQNHPGWGKATETPWDHGHGQGSPTQSHGNNGNSGNKP